MYEHWTTDVFTVSSLSFTLLAATFNVFVISILILISFSFFEGKQYYMHFYMAPFIQLR